MSRRRRKAKPATAQSASSMSNGSISFGAPIAQPPAPTLVEASPPPPLAPTLLGAAVPLVGGKGAEPLKLTEGLPLISGEAMPSVAIRSPAAVGVKVKIIVQLPVSGICTLTAQVPPVRANSWKFAPVRLKFVIAIGTGPALVSVTDCAALVVLIDWDANATVEGLNITIDSVPAIKPTPESCTTCGLAGALVAIDKVPLRAPAAVGVKLTGSVQLAPAATLAPHAD